MRRRAAAGTAVLLLGLGAWIGVGAALAEPLTEAQTPAVVFGHTQNAKFFSQASNDPFYILAIGSDARPGVCEPVERCLADSIHLIGVNPSQGAASILGFPRDSYVPIPGVGTKKINEALYSGGPELVVQTVEELVGVDIDYYLLTSFHGFQHMVQDIGGVEVEVPYAISASGSLPAFQAGPQELDGKQALAFARNRKGVPNGDFSRSENQGLLILSALQQLQSDVRRDPIRLLTWIVVGIRQVQTDLSLAEIFDLSLAALTINAGDVINRVVPGGIGTAGTASIVTLGSEADAVFADIADDGLLEPVGE